MQLEAALRSLGLEPEHCRIRPVSGGDIHRAWRVETDGARIFIKDNANPLPDIFRREAAGLEALRAASSATALVRVPEILGVGDDFLALQWIDFGPGGGEPTESMLGEGLAAIHRHSADQFGWSEDNYIGTLPQDNGYISKEEGCARFFARRRLQAQAQQGLGSFPKGVLSRLQQLCERIDEFLPLGHELPALLHGDLWGGNWSADREGLPWLYDPAVHFGCREAELAFTELFGGFGSAFYAAYQHHYPLDSGYRSRVDLWNLYPLLVHANLFGGGYIHRVERILSAYLG
jgi:protein-ribulosamine 3-kinase